MSPAPDTRPSRRHLLAAGGIGAATVVGSGILGSPRPARLGSATGDAGMATTLRPHLTDHRNVAIGLIEEDGTTRAAGFGADENTDFEIGSVTKTFTAALVMDAVDRGEITLDATVADVLGSGALGSEDRTLAQLASHTAGLPGLPTNLTPRTVLPTLLRRNPYEGYTVEDLREAARTTTPGAAGTFAYSNFSVSLEGLMVAEAAGSTWQDLVTSRRTHPGPPANDTPTHLAAMTRRAIAPRPGRWTGSPRPARSAPP
jgi:CubicO group peptidase (beta-lactamase class C family)